MYRDTTNVEPEICDYTSNNWSHWNSSEKLKEKFGSCTRKTFDRFTTRDSYTWNITYNMESTAMWSLKCERWGSLLVQEKCQEEAACGKRHPYRIIIIIIIIIITKRLNIKVYCVIKIIQGNLFFSFLKTTHRITNKLILIVTRENHCLWKSQHLI